MDTKKKNGMRYEHSPKKLFIFAENIDLEMKIAREANAFK